MIECRDVEYVLAIARHRSISNAACELYISQPALTKYLHGLEQRLGVTLFNRSGKRLLLTAAGECYIGYASQIAACDHQLEQEISRIRTEQRHKLKTAFSTNCARRVILEAVVILQREAPELEIEVSECVSADIEEKLLRHEIELGFLTLPCAQPDLEAEVIAKELILLGVPEEHPLAGKGIEIPGCAYPWMDIGLFHREAFVLQNEGTRFRLQTDKIFKKYGMEPNIVMTTRNRITTMEFAENSRAVFLTSEAFQEYLHEGNDIKLFAVGDPVEKTAVGAVYRRGSNLTEPAKKLLEIVKKLI